jgi:hypothetical protein
MIENDDYDPVAETIKWDNQLRGKSYIFEDGDKIEIVQVKRRDSGPWVTFHIYQGPGIPRKLLLHIEEFLNSYGHLFEEQL